MRPAHLSLALAALFIACCGAPLARAEDAPPPPKETQFFEALDKDFDGKVTLEEFQAAGKDVASFPLLDRNKDGAITPDELGLPADYKPVPKPRGQEGGGQPGQPRAGSPGSGGGMGGGGELRKRMKEMDADGDGRITRQEWTGQAEGFERFDRNKDGVLDAQDMGGGAGMGGGRPKIDAEAVKQRWQKMDRDADGKVSREEYTGDFEFERIDLDKDGFLTDADLKGMLAAGGGMGGPGGPGGPRAVEPTPEQIAQQFAALDKDASGKLEAAELPEPMRERALRADQDGDGALSKEEFAVGAKKARRPEAAGPGGPGGQGAAPTPAGGPDMLKRFDHDRDGQVTREQFPGGDEQFAKLDTNGDGVLTAADFPPPSTPVPAGPAPAAPVVPEGSAPGTPRPARGLAALDKDGDGRLCRPEWPGNDEEWRSLDKNTDGWLTADELAK